MTNYERICADKAFCAATIADVIGEDFFDDCKLNCRCKDCRDESKWQWRGPQEAGEESR